MSEGSFIVGSSMFTEYFQYFGFENIDVSMLESMLKSNSQEITFLICEVGAVSDEIIKRLNQTSIIFLQLSLKGTDFDDIYRIINETIGVNLKNG